MNRWAKRLGVLGVVCIVGAFLVGWVVDLHFNPGPFIWDKPVAPDDFLRPPDPELLAAKAAWDHKFETFLVWMIACSGIGVLGFFIFLLGGVAFGLSAIPPLKQWAKRLSLLGLLFLVVGLPTLIFIYPYYCTGYFGMGAGQSKRVELVDESAWELKTTPVQILGLGLFEVCVGGIVFLLVGGVLYLTSGFKSRGKSI